MTHCSSLTILLIDDCADDRRACCRFLKRDSLYSYRIVEFETGTQAIKWCEQEIPDVILLDFLLPDGDGLKFLQQIREQLKNTQCAVIMLTGQGDEMIAVSAMKNDAQDYLVKDHLTVKILQRAIHHAVEQMHLTRQLEKSREQQQLIGAIALRIRQTLKLEEILRTTATEVRHFLKADRVVVYKFNPDMSGTIVAESVLPGWTVALGTQIADTCFQQGGGTDYLQGKKRAINDIYQANLTECHLQLLEQFEVKAKLVVPILVTDQLWGFLIVHQCSASRQWQSVELDLLDQLGVQIAIAIQQASAYEQLQTELAERKQAEERLRQAQRLQIELQLLEDILETAHAGYWNWDIPGNQVYLSPSFKQMFGYEDHELPNTSETWHSLIFREDLPGVLESFEQHIKSRGQIPCYNEVRYQHKDGSTVWVICSRRVIKWDQDGNPLRMIGCHINITKRKQAEQEVIQNRHLREAIFNESTDALFLVDSQTLLTLDCNRRAVELFGVADKAELIGIEGHILQRHQFSADEMAAIVAELDVKGFWSREIEYVTRQGNIFWGNIAAKPITVAGRTLNLVRVSDISDRKQAEEQLKQTNEQLANINAELARATRLKDEFLANMSHELRTPLNTILGMSEGFLEGVFGSTNERQAKAIATIERSGKHLLELINDILDLSKIESGKLELQLSDVSVKTLCNSSLTFIKQMALKKNIHLSTNISQNIGTIQVDERRLRQVLINLLSNAIKFTPEKGSVRLEVWVEEVEGIGDSPEETLRVDAQAASHRVRGHGGHGGGEEDYFSVAVSSSPHLCFSVTDTGIGIAPEDIGKLFQPFIQLDSSLNRQYNGTGLGLALVKRIAKLHGGTVSVSSKLGQGSCFTVCIPYCTSDYISTFLPDKNAQVWMSEGSVPSTDQITPYFNEMGMQTVLNPQGESPLILLAEDNQANIDTMSGYLESRGYRLVLAKNGQQAIELTLAHRPDLIVMDIQMPIMDGLEAMHHICSDQQLMHVPIIALTALAMQGDRETCLAAGAKEYLTKPVKLKQLATKIQLLLDR
ncbi:response regulator [Pelatocladus sp. BLCC-F211]|uniref:response regulator n=1 Tax=Pelatocladus sp. BLCC-F211 TaxID=3342752 RepID=UPI0035B6C453